ncbi:MAG: hypothetical protein JST32_08435 [Bacteroidetes bacterium]|nr:hypothetical protein [Bacteroidota bacterium]
MKRIFFVPILWLCLVYNACGQSARLYSPAQMRQDIDSMVKYLEAVHPNPYYRYPRKSFLKDVQNVKNRLSKSLDKIQLYLVIESLLAKLQDGHTDLHINQFYNSLNPVILPYDFKLMPKKPFILCTGAYPGIKSQLPAEAQIVSVNDVPAKKIVDDIIDLNTGEDRDFRAEFGATRFYFYPEALYKANGVYRIKYKIGNHIKLITIYGIRRNVLDKRSGASTPSDAQPNLALRILDNETALIDFKSFEWDGFKSFVDSAFAVIKQKHMQNLIINLIGNSGGDSDVGDEFFQYISDKPFKQYTKVLEKNSLLLKARLKEHTTGKALNSEEKAILRRPDGSIDTAFYNDIAPRNNPLRFNGTVILLTDRKTYSSAADFAQCFKYYKRGLVIGEETGGLIKSYGDIVTTYLPNSQLEISISSKLYYDVGAGDRDWHGVISDIKASPEKALPVAVKYLAGCTH